MQPMGREQFVEIVTADQPDAPEYFTYDAVLNTREHATLDEALERELRPLSVERALALARDGAQLLDTRDGALFEGAHIKSAVNIGLGGSFATWGGTLLDRERPIVVIADPGREAEAATRLGRIGFDNVAGHLEGGMGAVGDELIERTERITAGVLAEQLGDGNGDGPTVIDVRTPREWEEARIEGSVNVPLSRLQQELPRLSGAGPLVVYCASGYRSAIAASVLQRDGASDVSDLVGGLPAWQAATS
jgi:rhodanese-related sulfurtransferase